ncbi:MAG: hypothetical protein RMJ30_06155 [Nitrososphaerota archaeon]|nr:hypothetical protein [Nitrososphaerota archaeon]MDW8043801.1 hypothetical protein [Nitrososphaerota archaeon]
MRASILLLTVGMLLTAFGAAHAEVVTFRQSFGGPQPELFGGIAVDGTNLYAVGATQSFGLNPMNFFLSVFRLSDNSHLCSSAVDISGGPRDLAKKVVVHAGRVYIVGLTDYGPNPPNVFIARMDASCNLAGLKVYDFGPSDQAEGLAISGDGNTIYVAGATQLGALLMAVRTSDLAVVWVREFKVFGGGDLAQSVAFDGGKLYVTGRTSNGDLFVSRFDSNGNHESSRTFATPDFEEGRDIAISGGRVYVSGTHATPASQRMLVMRLDPGNLNPDWVRVIDMSPGAAITQSVSVVGGIVYSLGTTTLFGTQDALMVALKSDGSFAFAFVVAREMSQQRAIDSAPLGSCVVFGGDTDSWPIFYAVPDLTMGPISFSISSPSLSIATPSPGDIASTPALTSFTPTINNPGVMDAFYSRFCPDALVVSTTTTVTTSTTTTFSTTVTSVVGTTTTAYDIRTTTITQTERTTLTGTTSTTTTISSLTTTTRTESTTLTFMTTQTLQTTQTFMTTQTLQTTQTFTTTQIFAEPITTYIIPALLAVIAALLGAAIVVGRRRRYPF